MAAYIWFDIKRKIKNPRTFFIMFIIFILSFQNIGIYNTESSKSDNLSLYVKGEVIENRGKNNLIYYSWENTRELDENIVNSLKLMEDVGILMQKALKSNDYKEFNRLSCLGKILTCKKIAINDSKLREISLRKQIDGIWDEISNGISYDDIYFKNEGVKGQLHFYHKFLTEAKHDYILYMENLIPLEPHYIDSTTFLYMYLNEVLPPILGLIILIMTFDNINDEWCSGSLKITLPNMFSRRKYLLSKFIAGVIHSLFVATLPAMIISLGYGIRDGFINYSYPILYLKKGFQTLSPIPNHVEFDIEKLGYNTSVGISVNSGYPKGEMGLNSKITLISLYEFLLLSLILLTFCIIFHVILNTLISSITKNKIIGFVISTIITITGTVISKPWTMNEYFNLSPFSMNNPVRILNGTYNTTSLTSLLVLIGVSTLLIIFNLKYFKKKDL